MIAPLTLFSLEHIKGYELLGLVIGSDAVNSESTLVSRSEAQNDNSESVALQQPKTEETDNTISNTIPDNSSTGASTLNEDVEVPRSIETPPFSSLRLRATAALVYDVQKQRILYEKAADTSLPLASVTK